MSDTWQITIVGCDETPPKYLYMVGTVFTPPADTLIPAPGWEGTLMGVPGRLITRDRFEIRPVDMRTTARKHLDEAADLLRQEPQPGERADVAAMRQARAQHLLLLAQLEILRRMENS